MVTPLTDRTRISLTVLSAAAVFLVDTFTRLQSAVAVLYALVLLIADDGASRARPSRWAYPCAALAILSFLISHGRRADSDALLRLAASLAAVAIAALLLSRNSRLREQVRASDARYKTIFNSLALAIWEHDFGPVMTELDTLRAKGVHDLEAYLHANPRYASHLCSLVRISDANDAAMRLMGFPLMGFSGKARFFERLSDFLPEGEESFIKGLLALDRRRPVFEAECQVRTVQGDLKPIFISMRLPTDGNGYDRVCGSVLDLTERKRMERSLEAARQERDEALHRAIVGGLSASISHEVSQPLSSINACLAAARRWLDRQPPAVSEARRLIAQAEHAGEDAAQVIAQVHDVLGRERMEQSYEAFDPLVRRVAETIRARQPTVWFDLKADAGPSRIRGEITLLERLVSSLIGHALGALDGPEEQRAISMATSADGSYVRLNIAFRAAHEQAERLVTDRQPAHLSAGSLGLCRAIAQFHGGSIRAAGMGSGSDIEIELELPRADAPRVQEHDGHSPPGQTER